MVVASALVLAGVAFASPASAGGGCHGAPPTEEAGTTVTLSMSCMTPRVLHVPEGAEVTFVNKDQTEHNLFGDGWFEDGFGEGESRTHRFTNGTFVYACTLHPGMVGAVVAGSPSAVRVSSVVASTTDDSPWWPAALGGAAVGAILVGLTTRIRRVGR